ncbi:MAG: peptidoglycan-binding protein [Defluviitaleaceae bacterium]|nr:peptidoglycan-binding protein [Defluviitaleaceae bacterium]
MPIIFMYNQDTDRMERYELGWNAAMPYNAGGTLTVREFRGSSCTNVLWSDKRTMEAWNRTRAAYGRPIHVGFAFKRIWEGGHTGQSQHYAGTSFDVGQNLNNAQRAELRNVAIQTKLWVYVEPAYLTPTWVHFDRRFTPSACVSGGYPLIREGSRGNYVLVLQDALNTLGFTGTGLDGSFGPGTRNAVMSFQRANGLGADGVVGCNTWTRLTGRVVGIGPRGTTIMPC